MNWTILLVSRDRWTRHRLGVFWGVAIAVGTLLLSESCRKATTTTPPSVEQGTTDVSFVGHEKCAECHEEIAATHIKTGHARTFALTKNSAIAKKLCGAKVLPAAPYGGFEYLCDPEGVAVASAQKFGTRLFPLDFAIGSGDHAVTYLTLQQDQNGETVGVEHRLTWFASDNSLDVTPGHEKLVPGVAAEYFGRVFSNKDVTRCIGCHTTTANIHDGQLTNLHGGVFCEKCHGPGASHVQAGQGQNKSLARETITRPNSAAEEMALCGSCHRLAEEISADRLQAYPKSLVRFQPVGLSLSMCFQKSQGELRCTTCHDPHAPVSTRSVEQQISTCQSCHSGADQKTCPEAPADNCIKCHMPDVALLEGISFHDHWIRRRPESSSATQDDPTEHSMPASVLPH